MAEVVLTGVSKAFGANRAVSDISMTIPDGAFVVLLGPTGAGKTTTLRLIAGLETPDAGDIAIAGRSVMRDTPAERNVAMVFQQYSLYPHLTVRENLAFPLKSPLIKAPAEEIERRIAEVGAVLQITHKLGNRATALSGGEMQRVAIGRALVRKPQLFLMDEPLSSLDAKLRADMRVELKRIQSDLGATLLYVTHDQVEAMTMATHVGVLDQGRLVQFGSPREIYENPASLYVATRLGQPRINTLPAGLLPCAGQPAATATIGARTEHLDIRPAANGEANGRIDRIEHLGDQNHLHITCGDRRIVSLSEPDSPFENGQPVRVELVSPLFFDAGGDRII